MAKPTRGAEPVPPGDSAPSSVAGAPKGPFGADDPDVLEAQLCFRRGIALYKEGELPGALMEMRRAYALVPTFKVLYNLAQISCELGDYPAGLRYFTRYLADGADEVPAERRQAVETEISRLRRLVKAAPASAKEEARASTETSQRPLPRAMDAKRPPDLRAPSDPAPPERNGTPPVELKRRTAPAPEDDAPSGRGWRPWTAWSVAVACAAGATVTGVMALTASMDLQHTLDSFPASQADVQGLRNREHHLALATDALAVGSAVALAVALYVTFSEQRPHGATATDRLALLTF